MNSTARILLIDSIIFLSLLHWDSRELKQPCQQQQQKSHFEKYICLVPFHSIYALLGNLKLISGSQIRQIWRISCQNCSDDSTEVMEGVTLTPEIFEIKEWYRTAKQEGGKLRSKFTRWLPSWIWGFHVSGPPQLLRVSLMIKYTCPDHVLESLKMAFFVVILDSKYSKMTPKFMKQKSHWLHLSIKFANPVDLKLILRPVSIFGKRKKLMSCVHTLHSMKYHVVVVQNPKEIYKKAWCTCKVVVWQI